MRVSSAASNTYNERVFTLVVVGLQASKQRRSEQTFKVSYDQLQSTVQRINSCGGRILSVTAGSSRTTAHTSVSTASATSTVTETPSKPAHKAVPVNLYKPKSPFIGTVTENYSLSLSTMDGSSSVLGLSVRVGNSMNCQIEAKEDGSWAMAGPAMTTQMMPPPEVHGEISVHFN